MSPFRFDPAAYGPAVADLLREPRLAGLGPGSPVAAVRPQLAALDLPPQCLAGLWLYFDFLHESHEISQDLHTPDGSYWHAIMHRREPDAWNSKYWWRKVGPHPVLDQLREEFPDPAYGFTTPEAFVDYCEKVRGTDSPGEELAQGIQLFEWRFLFDHCYRLAVGG